MSILALVFLLQNEPVRLEPETGPFVGFKESYHDFAPRKERPPEAKTIPGGATSYYVFPWNGGTAVVAASEQQLWPDRDFDGDLAEEEPIARTFEWSKEYEKTVTFPLRLTLDGRALDASIQMTISKGQARLTNLTRMSGKVDVAGNTIRISLADHLANGRYDDYFTTKTVDYWLCDHAHFDLDGDGTFKAKLAPMGEEYYLAKAYALGDAVYGFEVLKGGAELRFQKRDVRLATVKVNVDKFKVWFTHDEYGLCFMSGDRGVGKLPEGDYQLNFYDYSWKGAEVDGNVWEKEDPVKPIRVRDGMEFPLQGPMRHEVFSERRPDGSWQLWSICFGPHGERVEITPQGAKDNLKPTIEVMAGKQLLFTKSSNYC